MKKSDDKEKLHEQKHPFYGKEIIRQREQEYINFLLRKYKNFPVNEETQSKIWDELQMEKHLGHLSIPFKVVMRKDANKKYPDYIEIILDTKV